MYTYVDMIVKGKDIQWEWKKEKKVKIWENALFSDWWEDSVDTRGLKIMIKEEKLQYYN